MKLFLPFLLIASASAWTTSSVFGSTTRAARGGPLRGFFDGGGQDGGYIPEGMSKAEYDRAKQADAARAAANKQRKRGSSLSLDEATAKGVKRTTQLKGDAVSKQPKKNWLNPFAED